MNKKVRKLIIIGAVIVVAVIAGLALSGRFEPLYRHEEEALIVDGKPYGWEPTVYWHPKGDTVKIGRSQYNSFFPVYLYKYEESDMFVIEQPFYTCVPEVPLHRLDVEFPSFSAEVIDSVNLGIGWNMIYVDDVEYRNITITDPSSIAALACCFEKPFKEDKTKSFASSSLKITAESDQYPGIYFELPCYVYDGRYCLRQSDGTLYEIPQALLGRITGFDFYSPIELQTIDGYKRGWQNEKWKSARPEDSSYLFLSMDGYVILEVVENKAELKERGLYKVDKDIIRFYPEDSPSYSFKIDYKEIRMELLEGEAKNNAWQYDEESLVTVQLRDMKAVAIEQAGFEFLYQ